MRGRALSSATEKPFPGITPAYAGKSICFHAHQCVRKDHPRVCGEESIFAQFWAKWLRITPAYAGKSQGRAFGASRPRDHPRVCGEEHPLRGCCYSRQGSPPRMRGRGVAFGNTRITPGITPAYAGKSYVAIARLLPCWDHPRVCGEEQRTLAVQDEPQGSPPRMRGRACWIAPSVFRPRITPAYAGKSGFSVCFCCSCSGSPPRMRGRD